MGLVRVFEERLECSAPSAWARVLVILICLLGVVAEGVHAFYAIKEAGQLPREVEKRFPLLSAGEGYLFVEEISVWGVREARISISDFRSKAEGREVLVRVREGEFQDVIRYMLVDGSMTFFYEQTVPHPLPSTHKVVSHRVEDGSYVLVGQIAWVKLYIGGGALYIGVLAFLLGAAWFMTWREFPDPRSEGRTKVTLSVFRRPASSL